MAVKWEYLVVTFSSFELPGHWHTLNMHGDEGWELVNVIPVPGKIRGRCVGDVEQSDHEFVYVFKRPKPEREEETFV